LLRAVTANKRKAVEVLLAAGASDDFVGGKGVTPLGAAAYNGNRKIVEVLLKHGARPEVSDGTGKGAIIYAAAKGYSDIVAALLDNRLNVNLAYGHSLTALMWAAGHGNDVPEPEGLKTVEMLVSRGAKLDLTDDRGRTALMIAAERNHPMVVAFLLQKGADRSLKDKTGKTASDLAVNEEVRKLLQ
jgi:ankyrin repeat protein